ESRAGIAEIPKIEKPQRSSRGDCERFISPELNGLHARAEIGERHFELWWRFYQRREKCGARGEIRVREIRLLQQLQGEARLGARLMKCRLLNLKISSRLRAAFCAFPSLLELDHAADQRGNDQLRHRRDRDETISFPPSRSFLSVTLGRVDEAHDIFGQRCACLILQPNRIDQRFSWRKEIRG